MAFAVKDWKDFPDTSTPLNAVALEDMESRLGAYTDAQVAFPWTAWAPTWTNLTVGNGVLTARYAKIGKAILFNLALVWGSTTSIAGAVNFTLPVASVAVAGTVTVPALGQAAFLDASARAYDGFVAPASTTVARLLYTVVSGTTLDHANLSSTLPFTWVATDEIHAHGWYEAA